LKEIKRVLWFVDYELIYSGGGERLLFEGLKYFSENGIEACLYTNGNQVKPEALFNGNYNPKVLIKEDFLGKVQKYSRWRFYSYIKGSVKPINQFQPDVIIANDLFSLMLLWKANFFGLLSIPVVCFNHGSLFQFEDDILKYALIFKSNFKNIWSSDQVYKENISPIAPSLSFRRRLSNELLSFIIYRSVRYAKAIFVLTLKNKLEVEALFRHKKVYNLHGAFSKALFDEKLQNDKKQTLSCSGKTVIFSLCRLEKKKKIDILIKAFALYLKSNANSVLWIGGTGLYEAELKILVKELNLESNVIFIGFINDVELYDYYLSANLFVSADNADYDITTFVALALGVKAVVSSQHEFEPQLINKLVYLANPNPEDFAKELDASILMDTIVTGEIRTGLLESYTWEFYFKRILNIMESISR